MEAHEPTREPPRELTARWESGAPVLGVAFGPRDRVRILDGPFNDECASVRALLCVSPEPCYRVELDASRVSLEICESSLGTA